MPSDDDYKFQRVYSNGPLYAPVTGYFPVNGEATGLERLAQRVPQRHRELSSSSTQLNASSPGRTRRAPSVEVTIDPVAQQAAWDALGDYTGAVVVTEPATGRIIAMVSKPTYDPNALAVHDSAQVQATYDGLLADPSDPLINRAMGGDMNPPGSTFKLVVTAAALESGRYTPEVDVPQPAIAHAARHATPSCATPAAARCGGGAEVTLADAPCASRATSRWPSSACELGDAAIREQAEKFGFNHEFDDPDRDRAEHLPARARRGADRAERVRPGRRARDADADGDGVGRDRERRHRDESRPGGRDHGPRLHARSQEFEPAEFGRAISEETANTMVQMMVNGVENGAASNARIDGVSVAGKTGTAENGESDPYTLWFTGFAPADNPQYAITVLVEDGGGLGQEGYGNLIAAPIAKQVLEAVLNT